MIIFNVGELTIEKLVIDDVNDLFVLLGKNEIQEFIPDRFESHEVMHEVVMWLISNYEEKVPTRLSYKICLNRKLIGCITYGPLPYDESKKEVAYFIDPIYWGRGYATKTVRKFVAWLDGIHSGSELYAEVDVNNIGSKKVIERNDFEEILEFEDKESKKRKILYKRLTS